MNILITGANGFLGSYLVSFFNKKKYNEIIIGRSENSDIRCDLALEIPYLSIDFDLLIHCAGKAHSYPKNSNEENEFFLNNLDEKKNLFFAIKNSNVKIKQFVFVSSVAVYGLEKGNNISENYPLNGLTSYSKSKILAEEFLTKNINPITTSLLILRLPLIIGKDAKGNLLKMVSFIKKGLYLSVNTKVRKSMVLAEDIPNLINNNLNTNGIYNLTDSCHPRINDFEDQIAKFYSKSFIRIPLWLYFLLCKFGDILNLPIINMQTFKKMTLDLTFSDEKAKKDLNWSPNPVLNNINI